MTKAKAVSIPRKDYDQLVSELTVMAAESPEFNADPSLMFEAHVAKLQARAKALLAQLTGEDTEGEDTKDDA